MANAPKETCRTFRWLNILWMKRGSERDTVKMTEQTNFTAHIWQQLRGQRSA